ncbi:MAG: hypothetical protein ACLP2H_17095 [Terriglobales bacterium]
MNLKGFAAERAEREGAASGKPQPSGNQKKENDPDNEQRLAGLLLGLLTKDADDPDAKPPAIRTPEDYYAAGPEAGRRGIAGAGAQRAECEAVAGHIGKAGGK